VRYRPLVKMGWRLGSLGSWLCLTSVLPTPALPRSDGHKDISIVFSTGENLVQAVSSPASISRAATPIDAILTTKIERRNHSAKMKVCPQRLEQTHLWAAVQPPHEGGVGLRLRSDVDVGNDGGVRALKGSWTGAVTVGRSCRQSAATAETRTIVRTVRRLP
jgi:hypothetical protein